MDANELIKHLGKILGDSKISAKKHQKNWNDRYGFGMKSSPNDDYARDKRKHAPRKAGESEFDMVLRKLGGFRVT